jgi:XRE family transcriptional regulator, regulator of sulfur utilization
LENVNAAVAVNLKRMRTERQISLDRLAELTGVSKSMLGQIERGETSPTITTIWKIANGLKVSFSAFIEPTEPANQLLDEADIALLLEDDGKYRVVPFFCVDEQRNFEIFSVTMEPGGRLEAEPHFAGTQEYILIYSGQMTLWVDGARHLLKKGQAFRFDAAVPHGYWNETEEEMKCCMVLQYPR